MTTKWEIVMQIRRSDFESLRNVLISVALGLLPQRNYRVVALTAGIPYESWGDRQYFAFVLGEISREEHRNKAPMLSALVVHKGEDPLPGNGFYTLAVELGRLGVNASDDEKEQFTLDETHAVIEYWSKDAVLQSLDQVTSTTSNGVNVEENTDDNSNDKGGGNIDGRGGYRRGHDRFAASLFKLWDYKCAVTNYSGSPSLIRASHIKPWSESNSFEKVDRYNGLPLIPNLDAAFDRYLISFDEEGVIIISKRLINPEGIGINPEMRLGAKYNIKQEAYMVMHREKLRALDNQIAE